ncbi:MAG: hypothetical protein GY775_16680 [Candidatus Scalindua sp.]|nr:hypothetical protein [Candidatus Scalindua sp.]
MKKRKLHAFSKDVYLLGEDIDGIKYWLEAPSWDCKWYWGFGFIVTYTYNNRPDLAKDINSHQHADNFLSKWTGEGCLLFKKAFTCTEGWELSELFKQFYFLKEAAEMFGRGKAFVSSTKIEAWKDANKVKEINEILIPRVTSRIIQILTPE